MKLNLPENICRLRKERGMTQEQLAEALGVTFASVSKWERGVATPDLQLIAEMADLFAVSFDALVGFEVLNGGVQALEERIATLQQQKNYEEAVQEAEKALRRYVNVFQIMYRAGELYAYVGMEQSNEKHLRRAIELLEHAILLLPQNTNPNFSEVSIKNIIAQCYVFLGESKKAVEILKEYNVCGVHNSLIAIALTGNDITNTNTPEIDIDEATGYMMESFGAIITNSVRTMLAFATYHIKKGEYKAGQEAILWLINLYKSAKIEEEKSSFFDKIMASCYSECARCSLLLGEVEQAGNYLQMAYETAKRFDAQPVYNAQNIKFFIGNEDAMVEYDDLGESAVAAVVKQITQENRDKKLYEIWKKIEERDGERNEK